MTPVWTTGASSFLVVLFGIEIEWSGFDASPYFEVLGDVCHHSATFHRASCVHVALW